MLYSDIVLKYISDMLMDENMEEKKCMYQECSALQATVKPFYDILGENYPPQGLCNSNTVGENQKQSLNYYEDDVQNKIEDSCWIGDFLILTCKGALSLLCPRIFLLATLLSIRSVLRVAVQSLMACLAFPFTS